MSSASLALKNLIGSPIRTTVKMISISAVAGLMAVWGGLAGGFSQVLIRAATDLDTAALNISSRRFAQHRDPYSVVEKSLIPLTFRHEARGELYGFGFLAKEVDSVGVKVTGIETGHERILSPILAQGNTSGAVIGARLAASLGAEIGDSLVLIGQALDGSIQSDFIEVSGILKPLTEAIDTQGLFLRETLFRSFFNPPAGFHQIRFNSADELEIASLRRVLESKDLHVATWRELKPVFSKIIRILGVSSFITLGFTYLALFSIILNITYMNVYVRAKEWGTMKAWGADHRFILSLILWESIWTALAAALVAILWSAPCVAYLEAYPLDFRSLLGEVSFSGLSVEPILHAVPSLGVFAYPALFLLILFPVASYFPARVAGHARPVNLLRGGGA